QLLARVLREECDPNCDPLGPDNILILAPGVLAGSILAFARALGEFGATITFVANIPGETRTLPIALYSVIQSPGGEDAAMRLLLISVGLAIFALGVSEFLSRRISAQIGVGNRP
ncbi:MAG TPA: hypothetical protein EYQ81_03085, partial [Sneathiellales bacterium]|nr:hypothetical protein [Sneathiellales bacterium]